jgi:hypothetical protein
MCSESVRARGRGCEVVHCASIDSVKQGAHDRLTTLRV